MRFTFTIHAVKFLHLDLEVTRWWMYLNLFNFRALYMDFEEPWNPVLDRPDHRADTVPYGNQADSGTPAGGDIIEVR